MSNVLGRITVQVSTGETFHSAWREETAEAEEYAREVLSRVSSRQALWKVSPVLT